MLGLEPAHSDSKPVPCWKQAIKLIPVIITNYTLNDPAHLSEKPEVNLLVTETSSNKQETDGSWKLLGGFFVVFGGFLRSCSMCGQIGNCQKDFWVAEYMR